MKYVYILLLAAFSIMVSCSQGEPNESIIRACKEKNIVVSRIEFVDSIQSSTTNDIIKEYLSYINNSIESIADSVLLNSIFPEAFEVKNTLDGLLSSSNHTYLRYRVEGKCDGENIETFAHVPCGDDTKSPVIIADWGKHSSVNSEIEELRPSILSVIDRLGAISGLTMSNDVQKILQEVKEGKRHLPSSRDNVVTYLNNKGFSVFGVYASMNLAYYDIAIFMKDNKYYVSSCTIGEESPINLINSSELSKIDKFNFVFVNPVDGEKEKYTTRGSELINYRYNNDNLEWEKLLLYYKVY